MVERTGKNPVLAFILAIWPALLILLLTWLISVFFTEFTFISGIKAAWMVFLRFFRLLLVLMLPIIILPFLFSISGNFLRLGGWELIRIKQEEIQIIRPLRNWMIRPLQGIGLSMLVATKWMLLFGIYDKGGMNASLLIHPKFTIWRFLAITAIALSVSLMLSYLWGLDDLGIRLYNRKTKEIKMVGRYLGTILPALFGFYGIASVFHEHSSIAAQYLGQMIIILYPPFLIFNVTHAFYVRRKENSFTERLNIDSSFRYPDTGKYE
jgi:hypothetical protein